MRFSKFSLRTKLVLSYLGVTLGTILILSIAVTAAVQFNFATQQHQMYVQKVAYEAEEIGKIYHGNGDNWPQSLDLSPGYGPDSNPGFHADPHQNYIIQIITTISGNHYNAKNEAPFAQDFAAANASTINQCITQALQGQSPQNQFQFPLDETHNVPIFYVCEPIYDTGQSNEQIIGALFAAMPDQYQNSSPPAEFLRNVDLAILATGGGIALIAIIISLFLARGLTKPLKSLTVAAERMQEGDYTQRVVPPNSRDEIEHLAHAFNAMATTIETDVTELRRQEQLRRDMIANIAHDLATPLTSVQGFSEALADDVITNPRVRQETAQLIGREVQRLRRLVADMQNMSALEAGHLQLDLAPLNLSTLVNETLEVVGYECVQVGIAVRNEVSPLTPLALADSDRLTQVLLSLLDNAQRHTQSGGLITIGAKVEKQHLIVWVSDTGTGIDPADLPNIFERFYRVDRSRTAATGGSGLGLAIVKAIINAHGGTIHAESQPGLGTRIVFTLRIA